MFEIYNRKGSNDTFDDHHGQITQKDQPSRGHKTFICERKCQSRQKPANFNLLSADLPAMA